MSNTPGPRPEASSVTPSSPLSDASMTSTSSSTPFGVLLRADATPAIGVGHAMRLLALAQELRARGHRVDLAGALEIGWVAQAYARAGVTTHPAPATPQALVDLAEGIDARVCVLDRYDLPTSWGHALRRAGLGVVAMVDGEFSAHQEADLYVDQNPGSTPRAVTGEQRALAGASYTLFRDDVLALRRDRPGTAVTAETNSREGEALGADASHPPLAVLAVFGGTDPMGAAPVVTPLVVEAARGVAGPVAITVVTPDPSWADDVATPDGVTVHTTGALSDLAAHAVASDLVVTASGSSVWELLCLGAPIGVVCVIDNQTPGYDMVVDGDLAVGVGHLAALRDDDEARAAAVTGLREALADPEARRRRAARGQALLDGQGRRRVADAIESLHESLVRHEPVTG